MKLRSPSHQRNISRRPARDFGLAILATMITAPAMRATDGTWTNITGGGLWSDTINWSSGDVADGIGATANFAAVDPTFDSFVSLVTQRTLS